MQIIVHTCMHTYIHTYIHTQNSPNSSDDCDSDSGQKETQNVQTPASSNSYAGRTAPTSSHKRLSSTKRGGHLESDDEYRKKSMSESQIQSLADLVSVHELDAGDSEVNGLTPKTYKAVCMCV